MVSTNAKLSSNSFCQGVSGENAKPGELILAAYSLINSAAICLIAFLALRLLFCQSDPPIRCSAGASPPTYLVTCSKVSVGTNNLSAGWPRFDDAYSITRYSRDTPAIDRLINSKYLPTPCCSWTT